MNNIEMEKQALERSVEISRIMADTLQYHERENKRLWCAFIISLIANVVIAACMVWVVMNAQDVANAAMAQALDAVAEIGVTTETTTTTVTQDTGEGSGNNVYQDGDNTTCNEAGDGE